METPSVEGKKLNYKGTKPQNGEVAINEDGEVAIAIHDGKYCAEKSYDNSEVKISEMAEEDCKLILLPNSKVCGDSFIDDRDSGNIETYKTVKIGSQCWMAENLRYTGEGENSCLTSGGESSCNLSDWKDGTDSSCCKHNAGEGESVGEYIDWTEPQVLYQWGAVMDFKNYEGEIPTNETELRTAFEGKQGLCPTGWHVPTDEEWTILTDYVESSPGDKLKSSEYWDGNNNFGFNALPTGVRYTSGSLGNVGLGGYWWSSSPDVSNVWRHRLYSGSASVDRSAGSWAHGYSVRCVLGQ